MAALTPAILVFGALCWILGALVVGALLYSFGERERSGRPRGDGF